MKFLELIDLKGRSMQSISALNRNLVPLIKDSALKCKRKLTQLHLIIVEMNSIPQK